MKRLLILPIAVLLLSQTSWEADQDRGKKKVADRHLDEMIAAGKSPRELAQYVFETHACATCHTIGGDGKLGFTTAGERTAQKAEGCIAVLTAMKSISSVPDENRTREQRQRAGHFDEFGCTACHIANNGNLSLTEAGSRLAHLHLGCVEIERLTSGGGASQRQ